MEEQLKIRQKVWIEAYKAHMRKDSGLPSSQEAIREADQAVNAFDNKFKLLK